MNAENIKHLYLKNGFLGNDIFREFIDKYLGKEINYPHYITKEIMVARFVRPILINIGRKNSAYAVVTQYLNE